MDKITNEIVKRYITKIKKEFDATVLLFGSRAGNDYLIESDYDLCVISKKFEKLTIQKRMRQLYKKMIDDPFSADILALTPEEFEKLSKKMTIYKEIKETGIVV